MENIVPLINARDSIKLDQYLSKISPSVDYNKAEMLLCIRLAIYFKDLDTLGVLFDNFNLTIDKDDSETMKMGAMSIGDIYKELVHRGGKPDVDHIKIPCRTGDVDMFNSIVHVLSTKNIKTSDDVIIRNAAINGKYKVLEAFIGTNKTKRFKVFEKLLEFNRTDIPRSFIVHKDLDVISGGTNSLLYRSRGNFSVLFMMVRRSDVVRFLDSITSVSKSDVTSSYLKSVKASVKKLWDDKHDDIQNNVKRKYILKLEMAKDRLESRYPNWSIDRIEREAKKEVNIHFSKEVNEKLAESKYEKYEINVDHHL
jgi:hypothetical protein